jgi:hypothetical protein
VSNLSVSAVGSGTVISNPAGIDCGATCSSPFTKGSPVTLTATPAPGSVFTGWSGGGCSGAGTCTVILNSDLSVAATFAPAPPSHTLSVTKAGAGSGSVTSSPPGIDCGADCSRAFDEATVVTLTANPASGSTFTGWSGAGCSGAGPCTVTLNSDQVVTATFSANAPPSNEFTLGKPKLNKKKGTATLPVTVPSAGKLTLSGKGLKPIMKVGGQEIAGPGTVKLLIKATGKAKKKLKSKGKAKFKATVTFTPTGGSANSQTAKIKLVKENS